MDEIVLDVSCWYSGSWRHRHADRVGRCSLDAHGNCRSASLPV